MRAREAGYSLLEMLVVLAILGLIAALAVPPISASIDGMRLADDTRILAEALRDTREEALDQQRDISLTISAKGTIESSTGRSWSWASDSAVRFAAADGAQRVFAFHADGTAQHGAFRIVRGKGVAEVSVDDITGSIEVAK